jgi:hypothetical protein
MNREDIIRMAREAGFGGGGFVMPTHAGHITHELERFAALVAFAEREACVKVCEEMRTYVDRNNAVTQASANECANAIRARGQA